MKLKYRTEIIHPFIVILSFFIICAFTKELVFTVSSIIVSIYVIIFTLKKKSDKKVLISYLLFISALLVPVILGYSGVRPGNWMGLAFTFMAYFLFADYLIKRPHITIPLSKILFFSYLFFLFILFIISQLLHIDYGNYINKIFTNTSRNVVIYFCFVLCLFYLFNSIQNRKKISILPLLIFCFFCLISGSRTALILSILILLTCLVDNIKVLILIFLILLITLFSADSIESYILSHTNFNQGLETPRTQMLHEYIEKLDINHFLFGMNFEQLPTVYLFGSNPHNSFIHINMLFGFNVMIYVFFLFYSLYNYLKVNFKLFLLFFILIVRLSLDTVSYNNFFTDIFILYFIFNSFGLKKSINKTY